MEEKIIKKGNIELEKGAIEAGWMYYLGYQIKGTEGFIISFCGFMTCLLGGALMDVFLCDNYHKSGEPTL